MNLTVKKLTTLEERIEGERIIAVSFLHEWNEKEAEKSAENSEEELWGAFDEENRLISSVSTLRHDMTFEGNVFSIGELHMVGSLPEGRGGGAIRALMHAILDEYKKQGDLFAILIPFSFAFYRKFGFEDASEMVTQKADIEQFAGFKQEFSAKQICSQEDVDQAKELYFSYAKKHNLANLKTEKDWTYRGNGEFGQRGWRHGDKPHYSYLFFDQSKKARAYFTFVFVPGPAGPFTGTMEITELIFDSPDALHNIFGFFYGMRAKIKCVKADLPVNVDWSMMLPEGDKVERQIGGHFAVRVLNVEKVLYAMRHPEGTGQYSLHITDAFIPENTGTYTVRFAQGNAIAVIKGEGEADLELTIETFCQLAAGRIDLNLALYRSKIKLNANRSVLEKLFIKKPILLR